ncbi:MAG: hypothetical protein ABSE62_01555 [Chthoniobacteraceae bacterium]|jgi:outer membrane lipoprotein-sorting protein
MRNLKLLALCALLAAAVSALIPAGAQTADPDAQATAQAIQTLQDQQKTIADNQATIDQKLATISDAVHQARLFAARAR